MNKLIIILSILITSLVYGQNESVKRPAIGEISGRVIDSVSNQSMEYVTVALFSEKDSSLLTGAITNGVGEFLIKEIPFGNYYVRFSFIGYRNTIKKGVVISPTKKSVDFNKVILVPEQTMLEDVSVVAEKPLVVYEIDKKVINVADMNTVASATAIEVLENIPSITVDMDGNVSLRGSSGFTLLIDNKPTTMDASEALQLIPASNIKDIEIITNPSAKYNAEGTSGIINIILKKNKLEGISTLINLNGGSYNNYGGDFLVSVNKNNLKFNVGGNFLNANSYRDITQERTIRFEDNISTVNSEGLHRFFRTNYGLNTALEWTPNRKSSFSFGFNGNQRQYNAAASYDFKEFANSSEINQYQNKERTLRQFYGVTLSSGYEYLFAGDKDHRLNITGMYNLHDGSEEALTESFLSSGAVSLGNKSTEQGPSALFRIDVDYEKPLKDKSKLVLGARADFGENEVDQNSYALNVLSNEYVRMPLFSSNVNYMQKVYAGYVIYSGEFKKKLGYQFGVRSEYTDRNIYMQTLDSTTSIKQLDFFPSAHFSYQVNSKHQLKANISRRIQRPRSWSLEPFISWEDPYTVRQGNPNLLPEYILSYELGWIKNLKKGSFSTEIYHRNTINTIERVQEAYDSTVIIKSPINAGVSNSTGIEMSYRNRFNDWWTIDVGLNSFFYQIAGDINGEHFSRESFSYNARLGNTFSLKHDFKLQVVSKYTSAQASVQGRSSGYLAVDLALKKDFWKNKLSTSFQFRNALNSSARESWIETAKLTTYRLTEPRWPEFSLSIALRLNNYNQQHKIKAVEGDEF